MRVTTPMGDVVTLSILGQGDIASLAGTSRATVNRVLRDLSAEAIVTVARGRITVIDQPRLLALR